MQWHGQALVWQVASLPLALLPMITISQADPLAP